MYATDHDRLLMVATDNVSAYDRVLPTPIPGKGAVLTQLSVWWLGELTDIVPNHLVSSWVPGDVTGRAVVVERLEMVPVECVVRGYLAGSAWREYQESGMVAGIQLPAGLRQGERLERPIFTPARKAEQGEHDENITYDQLVEAVGEQAARELRVTSMRLYVRAERIAREHGLVLVDTKFEFGRRADGTLVLADEVLTPDSSRYWFVSDYRPGQPMQAQDKQLLRDYLTNDSGWDPDSGELPELPQEIVQRLQETYAGTFRRLTGRDVTPAADLPPVRDEDQGDEDERDAQQQDVDQRAEDQRGADLRDEDEREQQTDEQVNGVSAAEGDLASSGADAPAANAERRGDRGPEAEAEKSGSVLSGLATAAAVAGGAAVVAALGGSGAHEQDDSAPAVEDTSVWAGQTEGQAGQDVVGEEGPDDSADDGDGAHENRPEAPAGADQGEQADHASGQSADESGQAELAEDPGNTNLEIDETGPALDPQIGTTPEGLTPTQDAGVDHASDGPTVTFVVEVMPKPEILDPQGKAVTGALRRLGFEGMSVRQGKLFEIVAEGELTQERVDQVREAAERLLANTVIEDFEVSVLDFEDEDGDHDEHDHDHHGES